MRSDITAKGLALLFLLALADFAFAQKPVLKFGKEVNASNFTSAEKKKDAPIQWMRVNSGPDTWSLKNGELVCSGQPISVMRSEKQYENFLMHIEWKHMEPGGNSGIFVWSSARADTENPLPDGVEVQMLELDWVKLNTRDGVVPPIAYVHGELFGVGGVETVPDNPRGTRSKSIENLCKPRGEWNTYDVVCVDGVIKLSVNGKFVNGLQRSSQKKGYLCLESEGAEIHFRNMSIMELPPGITTPQQAAQEIK
jgi:hypothetical protein